MSERFGAALLLMIGMLGYVWGMGETWIATRRFAQINSSETKLTLPVCVYASWQAPLNDPQNPREVVFAHIVARGDNLPRHRTTSLALGATHVCFLRRFAGRKQGTVVSVSLLLRSTCGRFYPAL